MKAINAYQLLEKHAIEICNELFSLNSEQWAIRVSIEDEQGRTLEQALRILFVEDRKE